MESVLNNIFELVAGFLVVVVVVVVVVDDVVGVSVVVVAFVGSVILVVIGPSRVVFGREILGTPPQNTFPTSITDILLFVLNT